MASPVKLNIIGQHLSIPAVPLTQTSFSPFGSVITNPRPDLHPSPSLGAQQLHNVPHSPIVVNQGTAIKYQHVSPMLNLYPSAPSGKEGVAVMNMFSCAGRRLEPVDGWKEIGRGGGRMFRVEILERHPYTTQTFIPLSSSKRGARYLVIVAPSLPPSPEDEHLPVPAAEGDDDARTVGLGRRGLPDLKGLKAFVATEGMAVTYGAGTWHAPMVALESGREGREKVDFVVVQFANGVGVEDCQECVFVGGEVVVTLPEEEDEGREERERAKL
ncbi:Ureidoglycolate lyase [Coniochaeta pulveracea]|uniref:Ureidoglycolate lyase n=1 Tax=Coniochaeta pulveracea TaxID=177199 RepID=A0A420YP79_9PEZI|nr:Ureidoglycolate lyase [Coniochaeta pulveracea]